LTDSTKRISYLSSGSKENIYITQTNSNGLYILDLANLVASYSINDVIRVYCEWDGKIIWQDFTLTGATKTTGLKLINFELHKHSGLIDGCRGTVSKKDRRLGLHHLGTGLRPGLKGMGRDEGWK